jgi:Flp pilus assembly protein TadG
MVRSATTTRRGVAAIWTVLIMVALCGIISLAVDLGRVQLAKTELQAAADAACRAAAVGLGTSVSRARDDAIAVAAANSCDGDPVVLDREADIELGTWDPQQKLFTPLSGAAQNSASAIRVTARRVASRNTAIPLVFARLVGKDSCDVHAAAIATRSSSAGAARFVGLDGVTLSNNALTASYRSINGPPGNVNLYNSGSVGSNGTIRLDNNARIRGDAIYGPSGNVSLGNNASITGSRIGQSSPLSYPPASAGNAATVNDNSRIPRTSAGRLPLSGQAFSLNNNERAQIPAGTYYFSSLSMANNSAITFTGPVTIFLAGPMTMDNNATINTSANRPANLALKVVGSPTLTISNNAVLTADVYGPGATLDLGNHVQLRGAAVVRRIEAGSNCELYGDESLPFSSGGGSGTIALVQ